MKRYEPKVIEPKWQKIWDETSVYTADLESEKPKYIGMSMFNYPSGAGIHIGHAMNYTISDVKARFKRQQGYESYHPVGWDSFGLPAENYAIKAGVSPQESMATIIPNYHKQYKSMGWSNDWEKEIASHRPEYYKWTQWIFSEMYRAGLAYQEERQQWWCEQCQTVLANEQVIDGKCWRHDNADDPMVEKRGVKQWFFKITEYADELLDAIDGLDWTESVKTAQRNWIGRSEGAEIVFKLVDSEEEVKVFTTRPDTLFGATFMVVAPESDLVEQITTDEHREEVDEYVRQAALKSEVERQASKEKTGVFSGSYAINPVNNEQIPIWIADYVLGGYGTGAIMAVPAHDERDYEFAKKYDIDIVKVVESDTETEELFTGYGQSINSGEYSGLDSEPAKKKIVADLSARGLASSKVNYKMRDWSVSRQRYWGAPIPIVHCFGNCVEDNANIEINFYNQETWQAIEDGRKTVETRALNPEERERYFGDIKAGDVVRFVNKESNQTKLVKVTNTKLYESLKQLFDDKTTVQKVVSNKSYQDNFEAFENSYKFTDEYLDRIKENGIIALRFEPLSKTILLSDDSLPVVLPELEDFAPSGDGRSALARAKDWLKTTCPECDGPAERETDTLDTYICSSWYMLRYLDPHNQEQAFSPERAKKWMPIDFYNGGDHATAHMLYARFITRYFHKKGLMDDPEPFKQFLFNGKVKASDGSAFSKSKGNGVDPLEIINSGYGADALRVYLMFAGPLTLDSNWDPDGVPGAYRFLTRLHNLVQEYELSRKSKVESRKSISEEEWGKAHIEYYVHSMIQKVTGDIEGNDYNTAIAALMKCLNALYEIKSKYGFANMDDWRDALESFVMCVAPFAPHLADELWQDLGHSDSVHKNHWPEFNPEFIVQDTITLAVQVNGKVRAEIEVSTEAGEDEIKELALSQENVQKHLGGKEPKKVIYVKGRLVSVVV